MNPVVAKIQAAYERDLQLNKEAISADDLPQSYEAITDRWLTAVLCAKVPGAVVTSHSLGEPDNATSNRRRIHLEYNSAGTLAGLPTALFCKASHGLANRITLGACGATSSEMLSYTQIVSALDIEAPVCYFARVDAETYNSMIMLGDLTGKAQAFCNHKTVMTRQRAESQLRLLGKLHGACYSNAQLNGRLALFPSWKEFFNNTLVFGLCEGSSAGFLAGREVIPERLYKRYEDIWPSTLAAVEAADRLPATLAHGDVHLKNWYVAGNGEMGLSDWQCAARGHWGRDFAYAISTALTVEDRRDWERELLVFYLDQLAEAGGPKVDFGSAWDIYRQQLIPALTWWTITLNPTPDMPDMQPLDVTLEFVRRISTAMDDLDSLGV